MFESEAKFVGKRAKYQSTSPSSSAGPFRFGVVDG